MNALIVKLWGSCGVSFLKLWWSPLVLIWVLSCMQSIIAGFNYVSGSCC